MASIQANNLIPGKTGRTTLLVALGSVLALVSVGGYIAVQGAHKVRSCTAQETRLTTELTAVLSRPIAGATLTAATDRCNSESLGTYARFDGPIAQSVLVADYRQRAAELGWHERDHNTALLLAFEGTATDGTAILVRVWTDSAIKNGVVPQFTVDSAVLNDTPQSATPS